MKRAEVFRRDGHRCVYCGTTKLPDELTVDHVEPRMRGGDSSGGNVVTACQACNTAKGGRKLTDYLLDNPEALRNFFSLALYVWPRLVRSVSEELARRGLSGELSGLVEGYRRRRSSSVPISGTEDEGL